MFIGAIMKQFTSKYFSKLSACLLEALIARYLPAAEYLYGFNYNSTLHTNSIYFDDSLTPGQNP